MSMDLCVWSSTPFELPGQLPQSESWVRYPQEWQFEGQGWLVSVLATKRSEHDVPDTSVLQMVAGASWVAYATLEPIGADREGYDFLEQVVRSLARATSGVWVDPNGEAFAHDDGHFE